MSRGLLSFLKSKGVMVVEAKEIINNSGDLGELGNFLKEFDFAYLGSRVEEVGYGVQVQPALVFVKEIESEEDVLKFEKKFREVKELAKKAKVTFGGLKGVEVGMAFEVAWKKKGARRRKWNSWRLGNLEVGR